MTPKFLISIRASTKLGSPVICSGTMWAGITTSPARLGVSLVGGDPEVGQERPPPPIEPGCSLA